LGIDEGRQVRRVRAWRLSSRGSEILIAAQIKDFDPKVRLKHFQRDKLVMHADRYSWFAAAAADEAVKQSGLSFPIADPYRSACIVGSAPGPHHLRAVLPLSLP